MVERRADVVGRFLVCTPALFAWCLAGASAARWFLRLSQGRLVFGSGMAAGILLLLWGLVLAGACTGAGLACLTCLGFGRKRWQVWSLLGALVALWLASGD